MPAPSLYAVSGDSIIDTSTGTPISPAEFNARATDADKAKIERDLTSRSLMTTQEGEMGSAAVNDEDLGEPTGMPAPQRTGARPSVPHETPTEPAPARPSRIIAGETPSLELFLEEARPLNPGRTDLELVKAYRGAYPDAQKTHAAPPLETWLDAAKSLNPDQPEARLRAAYDEAYGAPSVEPELGLMGTLVEGAKATGRSLRAAGSAAFGDTAGVLDLATESATAKKDPALAQFLSDITDRKHALGPDASWFDAGSEVAKAAWTHPKGAGLLLAEQLPNSITAMGSAGAGALAGSMLGPGGTIAGGLAGLFLANVSLETGGKVLESAADRTFTETERLAALREGAVKGAVVTGVDVLTFGATKWLTGTTARAMEAATEKVLIDAGVDLADRLAVQTARETPELAEKVLTAQRQAKDAVTTIAQRVTRGGSEVGLEMIGEGAGEYLGEVAATGRGDKIEAVIEAFSGFGQSAAEIGIAQRMSAAERQTIEGGPTPQAPPSPDRDPLDTVAPIVGATGGIDDIIAKAKTVADVPPISAGALDLAIERQQPVRTFDADRYTESHRAVDQQALEHMIDRLDDASTGVRHDASGAMTYHGTPVRIVSPAELPAVTAPDQGLSKEKWDVLNLMAQAFGKSLIVFQEGPKLPDGAVLQQSLPNSIFLSTNTTGADTFSVFTHEALHQMEGTAFHDAFRKTIWEQLTPDAKRMAKTRHGALPSDELLLNEIASDIAGTELHKPEVWDKVFAHLRERVGDEQAKTEVLGFIDHLKAIITRVKTLIEERPWIGVFGENRKTMAEHYVTDLTKVHDALAAAVGNALHETRAQAKTSGLGKIGTQTKRSAVEKGTLALSKRSTTERTIVPPDVASTFVAVATAQRGAPEEAMRTVQQTLGGGVMSVAVEHAGDLIHRMTERAAHGIAGRELVREKVDKLITSLTHAYGFEKEHAENLANNARYYGKSASELTAKVTEALKVYANEHRKLPVYNLPQWLARAIATSVGDQRIHDAVRYTKELKALVDATDFNAQAFQVTRDVQGKLEPYLRPIPARLVGIQKTGSVKIPDFALYNIEHEIPGHPSDSSVSDRTLREEGFLPVATDLISKKEATAFRKQAEKNKLEASRKKPEPKLTEKEKLEASRKKAEPTLTEKEKLEASRKKAESKKPEPQLTEKEKLEASRKTIEGTPVARGTREVSEPTMTESVRTAEETPVQPKTMTPKEETVSFSPSGYSRTYEAVQQKIDEAETILDHAGINISHLYDASNPETTVLVGYEDWKPMPPTLEALYHERDAVEQQDRKDFLAQTITNSGLPADEVTPALTALRLELGGVPTHFSEVLREWGRSTTSNLEKLYNYFAAIKYEDLEMHYATFRWGGTADKPVMTAGTARGGRSLDREILNKVEAIYNAVGKNIGNESISLRTSKALNSPLFSPAQTAPIAPAPKPAPAYTVSQPGRLDRVIRVLQDKMIDIKRIVDTIQTVSKIPDELNPILAEEMYMKRVEQRTKDATTDELLPLTKLMMLAKVSLARLDRYLHARHIIRDNVNAHLQNINPTLAGTPEYDRLAGMTDAEAHAILDGENRAVMEPLAKRVDAIINKTRTLMVDYGLEKQSTIDTWKASYKAYVPLHREGFEEEGHPTGTGRSVRGSTVKGRIGSALDVTNILANVMQARDQIITRGEKQRPVIAMAGLLMLNPNPSIATLDKPAQIQMTNPLTGLLQTVSGDLTRYTVPTVKRYDPISQTVKTYPDPMYKGRDNVVNFRVNGEDYAIVFNERNERAMEAAKALKELDTAKLNGIMAVIAPFTRYLASINTQYNPIFGAVNFVRDAQFAMLTLGSTSLKGKKVEILKNAALMVKGIYQDARDVRNGRHPSSPTAKFWERFEHVGGPTGYRDLFFSSTERAADIEKMLRPQGWKEIPTHFAHILSDYNLAMENAIRLAVFKAAVEMRSPVQTELYTVREKDGWRMSDIRGASYAKNITVNFNKKGQIGAQMGSLYAFFNANVQGTARIAETMFERRGDGVVLTPVGKKIIAGGILVGVLQAFTLAAAGFGDDEPPEYIKARNLIIPTPGTKTGYMMLPLPLGFNLLPTMGRLAAETLRAGAEGKDLRIMQRGSDLFAALYGTFSPLGGSGGPVQELSPTVLDPLVALTTNTDWTGRSISKEDRTGLKPTPGHTRARDTATVWAKALSKGLNWATGGSEYTPGVLSPTPDAIDYLVQQVTGGVGREVSKASQVLQSLVTGEELPTYKIPLVGRFAGSLSGPTAERARFYENVKSVNLAWQEFIGRATDGDRTAHEFLATHPQGRLYQTATSIERTIGELQKVKHDLIERGAPKENIRLREAQITSLMQNFNKQVAEATELK